MITQIVTTPVGKLELIGDGTYLWSLKFLDNTPNPSPTAKVFPESQENNTASYTEVINWLRGFFEGNPPVELPPIRLRGTPFQYKVWEELKRIPWGQVVTYGELASRIGAPRAYRAVGAACGANPIPLIIPCHRVVAKNGLGGFGPGLKLKKWLLERETEGRKRETGDRKQQEKIP